MAGRHTVVKVCGLTRLNDARTALAAGADWLGFVVKGESPRHVSPEVVGDIVAALPGVQAVVVMVAPRPDEALRLATMARANRLQLHRTEAASWPPDFPLPVTFVVPVAEDGSLTEPLPPERHLALLDTSDPHRAGGSGRIFPWETARVVAATRDVMLAGGLAADNVGPAIEHVMPFGVDASSRLEISPGLKDPDKVRQFVAAVRAMDERLDALA